MNTDSNRTVQIIGVPLDPGASRRGTDVAPSALRIAGLGAALRRMGYTVDREEYIPAPAMETGTQQDKDARFKPQILEVCTQLTDRMHSILDAGDFPLVPGGVSFRETHLLMEYCADDGNLLSMEAVELNPFLDGGNVCAERTMDLLLSAMSKNIL